MNARGACEKAALRFERERARRVEMSTRFERFDARETDERFAIFDAVVDDLKRVARRDERFVERAARE